MSRYDYKGNVITGTDTASSTSNVYTHTIPEGKRNLMNPADISRGLLKSDGSVNTAFNSAISDYIPCSEGQIVSSGFIHKYYLNPFFKAVEWMPHSFGVCFYDKNKALITDVEVNTGSSTSDDGRNTSIVNTVPSGAAYVRVGFHQVAGRFYFYSDKTPEKCYVYVGDSEIDSPAYYFEGGVESYSLDVTPYIGKTWMLFGDSTVDSYGGDDWQKSTSPQGGKGWTSDNARVSWTGYFWASKIARELGLTIDNRAVRGSNINQSYIETMNSAYVSGVNKLDIFLSELEAGTVESPEYITIHFGANTLKSELGSADDESGCVGDNGYGTVEGAVKYFVDKIREKCPYTKIGFVLPYQCMWSGQSSVTDESYTRSPYGGYKAIKSVLDTMEYNVPYLDLWTDSGIQVSDLPDGIHESSIEAQEKYYHAMRRFMMGL